MNFKKTFLILLVSFVTFVHSQEFRKTYNYCLLDNGVKLGTLSFTLKEGVNGGFVAQMEEIFGDENILTIWETDRQGYPLNFFCLHDSHGSASCIFTKEKIIVNSHFGNKNISVSTKPYLVNNFISLSLLINKLSLQSFGVAKELAVYSPGDSDIKTCHITLIKRENISFENSNVVNCLQYDVSVDNKISKLWINSKGILVRAEQKNLIIQLVEKFPCNSLVKAKLKDNANIKFHLIASQDIGNKIIKKDEIKKYNEATKKSGELFSNYHQKLQKAGYVWIKDYNDNLHLVYIKEGIILDNTNTDFFLTWSTHFGVVLEFAMKHQQDRDRMAKFTGSHKNKRLAIIVNDRVLGVPIICDVIAGKGILPNLAENRDYVKYDEIHSREKR